MFNIIKACRYHQSESDEEELLLLLLLLLLEKPFNLSLGFLCFTFIPKAPILICAETDNKVINRKLNTEVTTHNNQYYRIPSFTLI